MREKGDCSGDFLQFLLRFLLQLPVTILATVVRSFAGEVGLSHTTNPAVISTLIHLPRRDAQLAVMGFSPLFIRRQNWLLHFQSIQAITSILLYPFHFYTTLLKMADNLRRAVQEINLRADDEPIALPAAVVERAAAENRFILLGRPVMPRRQNLHSIVAYMPRVWGQGGLIHGRIIPGDHFQFIFPSEESLETVVRRCPWAFNDRMLILQRWMPTVNPQLNSIPFWIQVRGIPYHYLTRELVMAIGRALGDLRDVDFDAEAAARVEFVRIQINWNVEAPLRFQRNFQFQPGVNTLLRFRY